MNLEKLTKLKTELDNFWPFDQAILHNLEQWFEVELTYSSNAIEGNTLTRLETAIVLEKGITIGGKTLKDHLEAINHSHALHALQKMVKNKGFSLEDLLSIHQLVLKDIDDENAGKIRKFPVRISGSNVVFPNYNKLPILLEQFVTKFNKSKDHPALLAALVHYELVTIHPFIDGNGRTARLLMNLILMQNGYPPAIIKPTNRLAYIKSLEKAQMDGSLDDYLKIIYKAVAFSLAIYLKAFKNEEPERPINEGLLKIGALSKKTGEPIATIRYWTKIGLIEVTSTMASGYQLFDESQIQRCKEIRRLQKNRLSLEEILQKIDE